MDVEYTGRQTTVTKKLKTQAEAGLARVAKIVGSRCAVHVVLTAEKHRNRNTAELTVQTRRQKLVAVGESTGMELALRDALEKVVQQAIRYKKKKSCVKRHPQIAARQARVMALEDGDVPSVAKASVVTRAPVGNGRARKAVAAAETVSALEPSLVRSKNGAARGPMSLEEAMKEAALRDRDVFAFRDHGGEVLVLHRLRDGRMELIEVP